MRRFEEEARLDGWVGRELLVELGWGIIVERGLRDLSVGFLVFIYIWVLIFFFLRKESAFWGEKISL